MGDPKPAAPEHGAMKGKEALLVQLGVDGVRRIYGNPGTVEQGLLAPVS